MGKWKITYEQPNLSPEPLHQQAALLMEHLRAIPHIADQLSAMVNQTNPVPHVRSNQDDAGNRNFQVTTEWDWHGTTNPEDAIQICTDGRVRTQFTRDQPQQELPELMRKKDFDFVQESIGAFNRALSQYLAR